MAGLSRPRCGREGTHLPHPRSLGQADCPGWDAQQEALAAMVEAVQDLGRQYAPPLELPAGARLELHPLVYAQLTWHLLPSLYSEPSAIHSIPVVVHPEMERGTWRLICTAGEVP